MNENIIILPGWFMWTMVVLGGLNVLLSMVSLILKFVLKLMEP